MDLDLTPFFKTKAQATDFAMRLAPISAKIYETNFNLDQALMDEFGLQKKDKFLSLLHANKINTEKTSDLKAFFSKIQDHINKLPVLSMTVAFEPKEKTLAAIAEWFMLNLKKQMLFEITVEPDVIAGAKINYKGKFLDASAKPVFDKMLIEILNPSQKNDQEHSKPTTPNTEAKTAMN